MKSTSTITRRCQNFSACLTKMPTKSCGTSQMWWKEI